MVGVKSRRAQGHARRVKVCKCGREIHGNAYALHVRRCEVFIAFYRAYAPAALVRHGIVEVGEG